MNPRLTLIITVVFINSVLLAKAFRIRRNALRDKKKLWPRATVPYVFDGPFSNSDKEVIRRVMKTIQSVSCIKFKKRSGEKGYVAIVRGAGCSADVGYSGSRQQLTLGTGCVKSLVVFHEFFHVLGFRHEHARSDRDKYIRVLHDNIKPEKLHNYNKVSSDEHTSLGLPYDFNSIMHYEDTYFAKYKSGKTMVPIRGQMNLGNSRKVSKLDLRKLRKLYRCSGTKNVP